MVMARFFRSFGGPSFHGGLDALEGRVVDAVWIDGGDQHYMAFDTPEGTTCVFAEAECCSESWFYHVLGVKHLLGRKVTSIEYLEMGMAPEDGLCRQDSDELYGYNLVTESGVCNVEFRNSSNGYYGGWLTPVDEIPKGVNMIQLTDDYTAQLYGQSPAAAEGPSR